MYLKIQNSLLRLSHSVADGNCVDFKKYEKKIKTHLYQICKSFTLFLKSKAEWENIHNIICLFRKEQTRVK